MMTTRKKVWIIDENLDQLKTYSNFLASLFPDLKIEPIQPLGRIQDCVDIVLNDPETATVIVDQKLKESGAATYLGIDLAQSLRALDPKLPIYILTNYTDEPDQFEDGSWSVEQIISKGDLSNLESNLVRDLKARLLRRIGIYNDILSVRETRFQQLLRKSLHEELSLEERDELRELQDLRGAPVAAMEVELLTRIDLTLREYEKRLESLRRSPNKKENNDAA